MPSSSVPPSTDAAPPPTTPSPTSPSPTSPSSTTPSSTSPPPTSPSSTTPSSTSPSSTIPPPTTVPASPPTTPPVGFQFFEDFSTEAGFRNRFATHVGNEPRPERLLPGLGVLSWPGDHDLSCGAPTAQRTVHVANHDELFWWCAPNGPDTGHVMTSMETSGYAIVSFTPNQAFTNVRQVCWDQNLTDLGGGKWSNVVIVPEGTYQRNAPRLDYVSAGFNDQNGPGGFNLQGNGEVFGVKVFRGTMMMYRGDTTLFQSGDSWTAGNDRATRYRHCVTDHGNGTVTMSQARSAGSVTYSAAGSFPPGRVRVIFQDDNYDTVKHSGRPGFVTWHWDNIEIR